MHHHCHYSYRCLELLDVLQRLGLLQQQLRHQPSTLLARRGGLADVHRLSASPRVELVVQTSKVALGSAVVIVTESAELVENERQKESVCKSYKKL